MSSLRDRLNHIINTLRLSKNEFAREIGISSAMISKITTKDINFGIDVYQKIISRYPEINQSWLLTGVGNMWLTDKATESTSLPNSKPIRINNQNEGYLVDKSYVNNDAPIYLERRMISKVASELMQGTDAKSRIYQNLNSLLIFQYIISNLDYHYFEKIDKRFYDINTFYDGKTFDFDKYRSAILEEIENVEAFAKPLENMSKAISTFYKEVQSADVKKIVDGYLNP